MVKNLFSSTRTMEVLTVSRNQLIMLNLIETRFLVLLAFRAEMLSPESRGPTVLITLKPREGPKNKQKEDRRPTCISPHKTQGPIPCHHRSRQLLQHGMGCSEEGTTEDSQMFWAGKSHCKCSRTRKFFQNKLKYPSLSIKGCVSLCVSVAFHHLIITN